MIIHSPIISGSLTFAPGSTVTLPDNGIYSGSFSGSYQGDGSQLKFGGTGLVSGSSQVEGWGGLINDTLIKFDGGFSSLVNSSIADGDWVNINNTGGVKVETGGLSVTGGITGSISATNGVVSGSSQVVGILSSLNTYTGSNDTTNTTQNGRLTLLETASGSAITRLTALESETSNLESFTSSIDATIKTKLNVEGVISGSSQILGGSGLVSGSSQVIYTSLSSIPAGIVSGSTQVTPLLPTGVISGSSQVNADSITNFDSNVLDYNNSLAVVSGSASSVKTFLSLGNVTNESKATMFSSPTFTGTVSGVTATHVGLGNVTNESKATMFTSPTFTGTPVAPTAAANTNSTQIATTAYVQQELTDLIGGANEAFDTLLEISASLAAGDSTLNTLVDGKLSKASNLSDLTNASTARTNLGLAIGTNVQAYNSTLAAVAGGTYSGDDSITTVGTITAGVWNGTAIANANLANSTISGKALGTNLDTLTIGTGLSGTSYNGSSAVTIANTGVTSAVAGNAITVSGATGAVTINHADTSTASNLSATSRTYVTALTFDTYGHVTAYSTGTETVTDTNTVTTNIAGTGISVSSGTGNSTITNTGVTSAVAGTGVSVSGATGAVTISIGQAVATSSNVQFNSLGIGMAASATAGRIDATNDIVAYSSSDIRFKENIKPIENALDKISKISGNTYDWKEENKIEHGYEGNDVGVIAQEIEEVLPQLVQTRENGYKAVKYDKLVALLIEGIKEQQKQIDELKLQTCNCNK